MPFVVREGGIEVLLVTARRDGRWILPKGWPERGEAFCDAAAREAREEAGVTGAVHAASIGDFTYKKVMRQGYAVRSRVFVFALRVQETHDKWPEKSERKRRWVALSEAAPLVKDRGLARLLRDVADNDGPALHSVIAELDAAHGAAPRIRPTSS